jgi:lipocalin
MYSEATSKESEVEYEICTILSRTSTIDISIKDKILEEAKYRGYDIDKFIWVEQ